MTESPPPLHCRGLSTNNRHSPAQTLGEGSILKKGISTIEWMWGTMGTRAGHYPIVQRNASTRED